MKQHEDRKKLYPIKKEATKFKQELNILEIPPTENEAATKYAHRVKQKAKHHGQLQLQKSWEEKPMHGKYPKRTKEADVDQEKTNKWLKTVGLKAETEGLIIAAQDQSLATRSYHHRIIKDGTDPQCRVCGRYEKTVDPHHLRLPRTSKDRVYPSTRQSSSLPALEDLQGTQDQDS